MAKPTVNTDWNVADNSNRIEPSSGVKNTGIQDGDTWGREWLNWQFYGLNQWINWVRDDAVDRQQNLADLTDAAAARVNIDVNSKAQNDARFIRDPNNSSYTTEQQRLGIYHGEAINGGATNLPTGWTITRGSPNVTITHNLNTQDYDVTLTLSHGSLATPALISLLQDTSTDVTFSAVDLDGNTVTDLDIRFTLMLR
tara:strand:- start:19960 stop:20553 length:594 start_codon:yes stop_codon:yes gene_type:complete